MNKDNRQQTQHADEHPSWESRLENIRQTRRINSMNIPAPLVRRSEEPRISPAATRREDAFKPDERDRDAVLREYLKKWQQEHNEGVAQEGETVETDAMVILQENWLGAQTALQMKAPEKYVESTRNVWLNPKTRAVSFDEAQQAERPSENAETESGAQAEAQSEETAQSVPDIAFQINILSPQAAQRKEVFAVSERDLAERLIKRLRPHLTDAVNGMIRVAVQKQTALLTYHLQQMLNEQAPALVEEVLEHNVQKILNDIKYEMKYKR